MPIATRDQYAEMLDAAAEGGWSLPAVNVTSSQTLNAAVKGFADARSDGIVQVTVGGARYLSGGDAAHGAAGLAVFAREVARDAPVLVGLHTDHCPPEHVDAFLLPLIEQTARRVDAGEQPLFHSHMFDGSTLALEENLSISAKLLNVCSKLGLVLEVECGVVGGEEDGIVGDVRGDRLYTTTEDLMRVAEVLGTGERGRYLLAATFGNVHGVYKPGNVKLRPSVLRDGQESLASVAGDARFQYVFHGSSGSTAGELREAIQYGVVKTNLDTDAQYAFTRAIADHVLTNYNGVLRVDGSMGDKAAYDPRAWGKRGQEAMAQRIATACEQLGSAGHAL